MTWTAVLLKISFQGQKQWPPKFHIKLRNTESPAPPLTQEIFLKNTNFFSAALEKLCHIGDDMRMMSTDNDKILMKRKIMIG